MNSMTGYGSYRARAGRTRLTVEARSVNHRFCETSIRMPGRLSLLEQELATLVRRRFSRGKFDLFVKEESADRDEVEIRTARASYRLLRRIQKSLGLNGKVGLQEIVAFRGLVGPASREFESFNVLKTGLIKATDRALENLEKMRGREGTALHRWFQGRLCRLDRLVRFLEREAVSRQGQKIRRAGLLVEPSTDPIHRSDVTEELVRLKSHLRQFHKALAAREAVGKKLDFLAQEMVREINTLGSKVDGVRAIHHVIRFKTELEKIREQIQNVE